AAIFLSDLHVKRLDKDFGTSSSKIKGRNPVVFFLYAFFRPFLLGVQACKAETLLLLLIFP
ncbi:MAG: hypothetical protein ACRDA8_00900, partial [Shewanella sp.]